MEELWGEDPTDSKVAARLATHFIQLKQKDTALVWYERAAQTGSDEINLFNFALTLSELGMHEKALHYVNVALKLKPDYVKAYALKGDVLTKMQKLLDANQAFEKALEFDPNHLLSGHNLCVNRFNLHSPNVPASVIQCFERFAKIAPADHEIHNHKKWILSKIQKT